MSDMEKVIKGLECHQIDKDHRINCSDCPYHCDDISYGRSVKRMDRETVITHLQIIHTWAEFARERDLQFFTAKHLEDIAKWSDDAIDLLKQQEAQKFFVDESGKITPLPVVVRCKDCKYRGDSEKCVLSAISKEKDFPLFMLDNRGEWFCADGVAKDVPNKEGR